MPKPKPQGRPKKSDNIDINTGSCAKCLNPDNNSDPLGVIPCTACSKWFHGGCISVSSQDFETQVKNKFWFCPECINQSNMIDKTKEAINIALDKAEELRKLNLPINKGQIVDEVITELWPRIEIKIEEEMKKFAKTYESMLSNVCSRVDLLEKRCNSAEKNWRQKNVVIRGIPKHVNIQDKEFLCAIAETIGDRNFRTCDVEKCFRINIRESDYSTAPIIIRFYRLDYKTSFLGRYFDYIRKNKLSLRSIDVKYPDDVIHINEHLDRITSRIFFQARLLKRNNHIHSTSIKNGRVMVFINRSDKPIFIDSLEHLNKVLSNQRIQVSNVNQYNQQSTYLQWQDRQVKHP